MTRFEYPEGATPLDLNEIEGLILLHVTTRGELDRWEQDNILEALIWAEKKKPVDILNEQFIKELHRRMFVLSQMTPRSRRLCARKSGYGNIDELARDDDYFADGLAFDVFLNCI